MTNMKIVKYGLVVASLFVTLIESLELNFFGVMTGVVITLLLGVWAAVE